MIREKQYPSILSFDNNLTIFQELFIIINFFYITFIIMHSYLVQKIYITILEIKKIIVSTTIKVCYL